MKFMLPVCISLVCSTAFADQTKEQQLAQYIQGTYILIGKKLDSPDTYFGEISITQSGSQLVVHRTISGQVTHGTASIEHATSDHTPVMRIRFNENHMNFEETCVVANDLDNYARITCYLYIPGVKTRNPGMEAFFIKPRTF